MLSFDSATFFSELFVNTYSLYVNKKIHLYLADSHPKSTGLVWGLVATRRSVYIHQMNQMNSRNDFGHDYSTINIVVAITIIIITAWTPRHTWPVCRKIGSW